jgi:hypothetical protein
MATIIMKDMTISEVAPTAFSGLTSLLHLDLTNNLLSTLPGAVFSTTTSMQQLYVVPNHVCEPCTSCYSLTTRRVGLQSLGAQHNDRLSCGCRLDSGVASNAVRAICPGVRVFPVLSR